MKKFEFPLDRVAKWSQQRLSVEQLTLLRFIKELAAVDERLQSLRDQVREGQSRLQSQSVLTGGELQGLARFVQKLAAERTQLQRIRTGIAGKIEEQRQRVLAEHRKVKLFDNLHQRRLQEWTQELSKEEDSLASELFLAKFATI